jgi:hypothetical protein
MSSSIEIFDDVMLPQEIVEAGVTGGQTRVNVRGRNQGGFDSVTVIRAVTMRFFQIGIAPMEARLWRVAESIYEITDAGAYGFLMEDPKDAFVDGSASSMQGYMLGVQFGDAGFGNGCPVYVLQRRHVLEGTTRESFRDISRPVGVPPMWRGGTPITIGAAPGNAALSAGPVLVTFVPDATRAVSAIAVGATTQVTLSSAIAGFVTGTGRLWLQGVGGADAALLNNQSHQITNIAGAVYTIATNTLGKTISNTGEGRKYPQPDEALTWEGRFLLPVHFRSDNLDWEIVAADEDSESRLVRGPLIVLDEVRES